MCMRGSIHKTNGKEVIFLLTEVCISGCKSPKLQEEAVVIFLRRCEFNPLIQISVLAINR